MSRLNLKLKHRLGVYLRKKVGQVIGTWELRKLVGEDDLLERGLGDLREEGWGIQSSSDSSSGLESGQYRVVKAMPLIGSKKKIEMFLRVNLGRVLETEELHRAAGGALQYGRRSRELRAEGWKILSHHDDSSLKPGQYLLREVPAEKDIVFARGISSKLRAQVMQRNGFMCQKCGITPQDIDPHTNRKARMHIGHIKSRDDGGKIELSNLLTECSTCNQGAKNVTFAPPTARWLMSQVRQATRDTQRILFEHLKKVLGKTDLVTPSESQPNLPVVLPVQGNDAVQSELFNSPPQS